MKVARGKRRKPSEDEIRLLGKIISALRGEGADEEVNTFFRRCITQVVKYHDLKAQGYHVTIPPQRLNGPKLLLVKEKKESSSDGDQQKT